MLTFRAGDHGIIPAYAGSTQIHLNSTGDIRDHPRIRGEHAPPVIGIAEGTGSSPHTRGARSSNRNPRKCRRIIPAYAGSTLPPRTISCPWTDHPRIRGEHRRHSAGPRTRYRIIPAYAGSTKSSRKGPSRGLDHPRIRGEHYACTVVTELGEGSSPHTRGALACGQGMSSRTGIIPAYAGSTCDRAFRRYSSTDHPRIRGEHDRNTATQAMIMGSSPHTRGAPPRNRLTVHREGIIPAYAGSTFRSGAFLPCCTDHPRIRGEHGVDLALHAGQAGSSPHTRGAHARLPAREPLRRIIPAYAGSTRRRRSGSRRVGDHPRIRGEH